MISFFHDSIKCVSIRSDHVVSAFQCGSQTAVVIEVWAITFHITVLFLRKWHSICSSPLTSLAKTDKDFLSELLLWTQWNKPQRSKAPEHAAFFKCISLSDTSRSEFLMCEGLKAANSVKQDLWHWTQQLMLFCASKPSLIDSSNQYKTHIKCVNLLFAFGVMWPSIKTTR